MKIGFGKSKNPNASKHMVTQGFLLTASTFIVRILNVFYRVPVTNLWGDAGLGTYGDAYQVYSFFLVFASFSIPSTLSKLLSERLAAKRTEDARRVVKAAFALVGGIGALCMLVMLLFGKTIAIGMYNNPDAARPIRFLGPTVLVVSLMSVLRGYFQGLNDMKPTAVSEVIEGFLHAVFAVVLAFILYRGGDLSWSVTGGIFGTLLGAIGGILFLAVLYVIYRNRKGADPEEEQTSPEESYGSILKQMITLMVPIILASTAFSIKGIVDSSMFAKLMSAKGCEEELAVAMRGIYTGKFVVLINLPISIGDAFGSAAIPSVSAAQSLGQQEEVKNHFRTILKTTLIIAVPCAVGLGVLGKPVLRLLFPGSYLGGELFWVGGLAVIFYSLNCVITGVLQGMNRAKYPMYHAIIGVILSSLLNVLTICVLNLGIYSLAINSVFYSLLIMVLNLRSCMKFCDIRINLWELAKGPVLCSLLMGVGCLLFYVLFFAMYGSNTIATVVSIAVGVLLYFTLMVNLKGLSPQDLETIPGGRYFAKLKL